MEAKPGLRPFDLEAAKRGAPLVTRDGRLAKFSRLSDGVIACLVLAEGGEFRVWSDTGLVWRDGIGRPENNDVFMVSVEEPTVPIHDAKLIPFDLEAAKRGEPVITRDGRKIDELHHFETRKSLAVAVSIGGNAFWVEADGTHGYGPSDHDLFMAPKPKRTVYVNVYIQGNGSRLLRAEAYPSREKAELFFDDQMRIWPGTNFLVSVAPIEVEDWEASK